MTDPNHAWNSGAPIRSRKQSCGCHVTARKFELCTRGKDLKKSADGWYKIWQAQKDMEIDPKIVSAHLADFEVHRDGYLKHIATGKDWVL
jgi:hypothetical protein